MAWNSDRPADDCYKVSLQLDYCLGQSCIRTRHTSDFSSKHINMRFINTVFKAFMLTSVLALAMPMEKRQTRYVLSLSLLVIA